MTISTIINCPHRLVPKRRHHHLPRPTSLHQLISSYRVRPVVTLLGQPVVTVNLFSQWEDPGALAQDAVDGPIPVTVLTPPPVNFTSMVGAKVQQQRRRCRPVGVGVHLRSAVPQQSGLGISRNASVQPDRNGGLTQLAHALVPPRLAAIGDAGWVTPCCHVICNFGHRQADGSSLSPAACRASIRLCLLQRFHTSIHELLTFFWSLRTSLRTLQHPVETEQQSRTFPLVLKSKEIAHVLKQHVCTLQTAYWMLGLGELSDWFVRIACMLCDYHA
eukprot:366182-Chlamydomonas_euryale.AAC.10